METISEPTADGPSASVAPPSLARSDGAARGMGIRSSPRSAASEGTGSADNLLLEVEGLKMHFPITRGILIQRRVGAVHAVDGIDFFVRKGETLGLVGESGCGKSTAGRAILQLYKPTGGKV